MNSQSKQGGYKNKDDKNPLINNHENSNYSFVNSDRNGSPLARNKNDLPGSPPIQDENQQDKFGVNQVLVYQLKDGSPTYYIPCYLRMGVVRVRQIDYIQSKATIQTEIRIWSMISQFPKDIQTQIMNQTKLTINSVNRDFLINIRQPPKLDASYIRNTTKKSIGFIISEQMELDIESDPFWSPFQLIKLVANLQIKKITIGDTQNSPIKHMPPYQRKKYEGAQLQFNFLDAHPFLQFSFGQVKNLGSFDIAESMVDMKWTSDSGKSIDDDEDAGNQKKKQQEQQSQFDLIGQILGLQGKVKRQKILSGQLTPDAYEHGQIVIPLYKYPSSTIISVFVPFYILAVLNLGVFFQLNDMSNRDGSLATFVLAYIAFFPTIRKNLPQTPKLVFSQIMVYIQSLCTLLCFFYSLYVNKIQDYAFDWQTSDVFLACMILTILNIATVAGLFLTHKLVWQRGYNKLPPNSHKYIGAKKMNTDDSKEWWNQQCAQQFKPFYDLGVVKPFKAVKKKKENFQSSSFKI